MALLVLPALAVLGAFVYWPLIRTLYLSTHGADLFGRPTGFIGLRYYVEYFTNAAERSTLVTTLWFTVLTVAFTLVPALVLTLLLGGSGRGGALARVVFSLPFAYSAGSASVLFAALFNPATGILGQLLGVLGVGPVSWLGQSGLALVSVAAATAWWQLGFAVLVLTAAIRAAPAQVVEAARLDGAGHLRCLFRIVLPPVRPTLVTAALWSALGAWNGYFWPLLITDKDSSRTIQVGLGELTNSDIGSPGQLLAGVTLVLLPTLVLILAGQRALLTGLARTGVN